MSDAASRHPQAPTASVHRDEEKLYRLERALQLAYAVGDRHHIRCLESELETFTGFPFQFERMWLANPLRQSVSQ